ncbi:MAG: HAMP domain-containing protein [bacterium]|nr:HAMP domain-containing protein [bacterium]
MEKLKKRIDMALGIERENIQLRGNNWAAWDLMANYVENPSPEFEKETFPDEIFTDDDAIIDLVSVFRYGHGVVFYKCYKDSRFLELETFRVDQAINRVNSRIRDNGKTVKEVLSTNFGPVMMVATPILSGNTGDGSGKRLVGALLAGRFIGKKMLKNISDYTMENVGVLELDESQLEDFHTKRMKGKDLFYEDSGDRLMVYYLIKDINDKPAMVLTTGLDNELFRVMNRHLMTLIVFIFLVIVLLGLRLYFSIDKQIVKRVRSISSNMGRIEGLNDLSKRVESDNRRDEIAFLVKDINIMLDKLEQEKKDREIAERSMITQGKLASIGRLSSCIAHEVNNPLLAISNSMQVIKKVSRSKSSLYKEAMEITESEINRIRDIISSLLDFHRYEQEPHARVDVRDVVNKSLSVLEWSKKLGATTKIIRKMEDSCLVCGSSIKLKQVFINFILNAAEAMEETTPDPTLYIQVKPSGDGNFVEVHIMDNGPGIPDDIKGHLYEPFVSTKEATGVGLGLYISYKIIDSHRGEIIYDEEYASGTHFIIKLPGSDPFSCDEIEVKSGENRVKNREEGAGRSIW